MTRWMVPAFSGFISGYLFFDLGHYAFHHFETKSRYIAAYDKWFFQIISFFPIWPAIQVVPLIIMAPSGKAIQLRILSDCTHNSPMLSEVLRPPRAVGISFALYSNTMFLIDCITPLLKLHLQKI